METDDITARGEALTRIIPYVGLSALLCVIIITIAVYLLTLAFPSIIHLLDGPSLYYYPSTDASGNSYPPPNPTRNLLEILFFIGGTVIAIGVYVAYQQLKDGNRQSRTAERTQKGNLFVAIEQRWSSPEVRAGKSKIAEIAREFYGKNQILTGEDNVAYLRRLFDPLRSHMCDRLRDLYKSSQSQDTYANIMSVTDFFEYVGLLVYNNYVNIEDIEYLVGVPAVVLYEHLELHIDELRDESQYYNQSRKRYVTGEYALYEYLVEQLMPRFLL